MTAGKDREGRFKLEKIIGFKDKCMIIRVREESPRIRGSLYEAVRRCWRASIVKARQADYVLAIVGRSLKVQGVFKPERWYHLSTAFCEKTKGECETEYNVDTELCKISARIAFEGKEIPGDLNYLHKEIPKQYFPGLTPFRYTY